MALTDEDRAELERQYTLRKVETIDELRDAVDTYKKQIADLLEKYPRTEQRDREAAEAIQWAETLYKEQAARVIDNHPDWDAADERALEKLAKDPDFQKLEADRKNWEAAARFFELSEKDAGPN